MTRLPFDIRIVLIYALVGAVWIVGTDWLVLRYADPQSIAGLQTLKGWVFVALSALLLFWLTRRHLREQEREKIRMRGLQDELRTAQDVAGVAHWSMRLDSGTIHWSGAVDRILGMEPGDLDADVDTLYRLVHPDDRERVRAALEGAQERPRPVDLTHRILRPDGEVRWVRARLLLAHNGQRGHTELIGTLQDVTEPTLAERRLRASRAQLKALSAHLQEAREEERRALSMDIHDHLGGTLAGIRMTLSHLLDRPEDPERVKELVERIDDRLEEAVRNVRHLAREMRPGILDELGVAAAVEWLVQDLSESSDTRLDLRLSGEERIDLSPERGIHLFRVAQEALTNVLRHGEADEAVVRLEGGEDEVYLQVDDDGCGFDRSHTPRGLGLLNMRERADLIDGRLSVRSEVGRGTTVELRVPRRVPAMAGSP